LTDLSYVLFRINNLADKMVNSVLYEFYLNLKKAESSRVISYSSLGIKGEQYKEGILSLVKNGVSGLSDKEK